jgi:hypothetical protein
MVTRENALLLSESDRLMATYCRGYMVETEPPSIEGTDWQWMLSNACVRAGFPLELEYVKEKARNTLRHYPGIPIEGIIECRYLPT